MFLYKNELNIRFIYIMVKNLLRNFFVSYLQKYFMNIYIEIFNIMITEF